MQELQQYLPFTVLKLAYSFGVNVTGSVGVATVLTVYGIETRELLYPKS